MKRRDFLSLLPLGAWSARAADAPFHFTNLDHIEFTVADVFRARDFYGRAFGYNVMKNNRTQRRYVQIGDAYVAFEPNVDVRVDHFSAGISGFDVNRLHDYLKERNIAYRDFPSGRDLNVTDADGLRLQLSADQGWTQLGISTASMEPFSGPLPAVNARGLDHVLLDVTDVAQAEAFYSKILGTPSDKAQGITWFAIGSSKLGLRKTAEKPKVARIGVRAATTSTTRKRLEDAGATFVSMGPFEFRDPDGFVLQLVG